MIKEFRDFVLRGNVLDLAVGIIIGAAFTAIVNSLVADIINPVIGILLGNVDVSNIFVVLRDGTPAGPYPSIEVARAAGANVIAIGLFIQAIINFVIVAFVLFLILRSFNRMMELTRRRKAEVVVETPPADPAVVAQQNLTASIERLNANLERRPLP